MSNSKNVLLLVGSPRGKKSTSKSLGSYLINRLETYHFKSYKFYSHRVILKTQAKEEFLEKINLSDVIILTFPLYVDSLPAPNIELMEFLNTKKEEIINVKQKRFLAISNCGFPEAVHIDIAMKICENFAQELGLQWVGGFPVGGGEMIHGRALGEMGRMVQNIRDGLDLVASSLNDNAPVPQKAFDLISEQNIPTKIYKIMGNMGWRFQGLGNRNMFNLKKKKYKKE